MGFYMFLGAIYLVLMTADDWGGPHWLVMAGEWYGWLCLIAGVVAVLWSVCHQSRVTPVHGHDSRPKNR